MIAAEALVAVTGIAPRDPITRADGHAAEALPREWRKGVRDFFDLETPRKFRCRTKRPDFRDTYEKLGTGLDAEETMRVVSKLAPDAASAYLAHLSDVREYVRSIWPMDAEAGPFGPEFVEPSTFAQGFAWAIWDIANGPERALTELGMASLDTDEATALKACYPELYAMLCALVQEELIRRRSERKSWRPRAWQMATLKTLFLEPQDSPLVSIEQPPPQKSVSVSVNFGKSSETRAQRLDER